MEKEEKVEELGRTEKIVMENAKEFQSLKAHEKKKGHGKLIFFLILIIIGLVGYICYDKGVFDNWLAEHSFIKKDEPKTEKKLSEEEVKKLHDSLIVNKNSYGFYFEKNVTIDDIAVEDFLPYVFIKYSVEKNIGYVDYNLQCLWDYLGDANCKKDKIVTVSKSEIDDYISKTFNTTRIFTLNATVDNAQGHEYLTLPLFAGNEISSMVSYNVNNNTYYFGYIATEGYQRNIISKYIKYETDNDNLYIYDKVLVCEVGWGNSCSKMIKTTEEANKDNSSVSGTIVYMGYNNTVFGKGDKEIPNGIKYYNTSGTGDETVYTPNTDLIFEDFASDINTYKHTFKKGTDGKYYWYSSEIVNE